MSIQKIKAMLLCIEYGILFVDTVDTKIKAYNALNAMFVDTVDTKIKAYNTLNAMFVDTGVCGLSRKSSMSTCHLSVFSSTFQILDEPRIDSVDIRMDSFHPVLKIFSVCLQ